MRATHILLVFLLAIVWSSCSSTRWVHPYKKEEQYTYDYNTCERELLMKMSEGRAASMNQSVLLTQDRINQCLRKQGWREIEKN